MKRIKWICGLCSLLLCAVVVLSACEQAVVEPGSNTDRIVSQDEKIGSTESMMTPEEDRRIYLQGLNINSAPVDLSDLAAVTAVYVSPLPNDCYLYGWKSVSEITADNLIEACAKDNFLKLPRDEEDCYFPESAHALAEDVEAAVQEHFDVDVEYLRKSRWYEKEDHTYSLVSGFGGGWSGVAVSAKQTGSLIIIEIAIEKGVDDSITPVGTLTVELTQDKVVRYISYEFTNESFSL